MQNEWQGFTRVSDVQMLEKVILLIQRRSYGDFGQFVNLSPSDKVY
jgi:hypothetical protein